MTSGHDSERSPDFEERRRHKRQSPVGVSINLPATYNAEILDISSGGALISTPAEVAPGQRGQLRTLLEREPFSAIVEVLRIEVGTRNGADRRNHVGLGFVSLDDNSRKTLNRFVKSSRSR